jgi:hypothetical protein
MMSTQRYNKYIVLGIGLFVVVAFAATKLERQFSNRPTTVANDHQSNKNYTPIAERKNSEKAIQPIPRVGKNMDGHERRLYAEDPSSAGYTEADRDFFRGHGVSEQEARAAETVLRENGID